MATKNGKVKVSFRGRFSPGTTVGLHPRVGDTFSEGAIGKPLKTAKVDRDNRVTFSDVAPDTFFWVVGETSPDGHVRGVALSSPSLDAPEPDTTSTAAGPDPRVPAELQGQTRDSGVHPGHRLVTGPRGTKIAKVAADSAIPAAHEKTPAGEMPDEPQPRIKQADVPAGTPQRSDTPMGEGHPVDPDELQPKVPQSAVPPGTPQRSDTPLGEATPVDPDELQPGVPQEDVPKGTKQRSDTPTGTAEPIPQTSPVKQAKARSSSKSKARGASKGQAAKASRPKSARSKQRKPANAKGNSPARKAR